MRFFLVFLCGNEVCLVFLCGNEVCLVFWCGNEVCLVFWCGPEVALPRGHGVDGVFGEHFLGLVWGQGGHHHGCAAWGPVNRCGYLQCKSN